MNILPKQLGAAIIALLIATNAMAKEKAIGKATSVVHVQELRKGNHVIRNSYCPVRGDSTFQEHCKKGIGYQFKQGSGNPNTDYVQNDGFYYMIHWQPAKTPGTYAWVSGSSAIANHRLKQETLLAKIVPGTVVIDPYYSGGSKSERAAVMARIKALFVSKYAPVAKQLTFRFATPAPVKCLKPSQSPKDGFNCTLK